MLSLNANHIIHNGMDVVISKIRDLDDFLLSFVLELINAFKKLAHWFFK